MAIREELTLGLSGWKTNLDKARDDVKRFHEENKRASRASSTGGGSGMGGGFLGSMGSMAMGLGGQALGVLGVAGGITGMTAAIKESLSMADDLADLALKLNDSAEALQRVDFAGKQAAGVGVAQIGDSMIRLEKALGDVENAKVAEVLERLGLSASDLTAMPLDQKILAFSEAFQKARETGSGVADIQALLGRSAGDLIPLFEQTGDALRGMFEDAPVLAEATVQEMAKINDEIDAMIEKGKNLGSRAVGGGINAAQFVGRYYAALLQGEGFKGSLDVARGMEESEGSAFEQDAAARDLARTRAGIEQKWALERAGMQKLADAEAEWETDKARRADAQRQKEEQEAKRAADELAKKEEADLGRVKGLRFDAMPVEEQVKSLTDQLKYSLGAFSSREEALSRIDQLIAAGLGTEALTAMGNLNQLQEISGRIPAGETATGAAGSFAGLMDQIFGRGTPEQQLDEMRKANTLAEDTSRTLDMILVKMDQTPAVSVFGED